jgi:hypothetical protein
MSGLWDDINWDILVDSRIPPGVIVICDAKGKWWPIPLVEFTEDEDGAVPVAGEGETR